MSRWHRAFVCCMLTGLFMQHLAWCKFRPLVVECMERDMVLRSMKTALVVGTVLAVLNHGQDLLNRQFSPRWVIPMGLTYLVPFVVATYGQIQGKRQHARARTGAETLHPAMPKTRFSRSSAGHMK